MAAHTRKRNAVFTKDNGSQCTVVFVALERKKQSLPPEIYVTSGLFRLSVRLIRIISGAGFRACNLLSADAAAIHRR